MRAARFHEFGGPEVLRVEHTPWPLALQDDELLVRVLATSVNGTDLGVRRGAGPLRLFVKRPFVPGFDVAGEIVRVGRRVTDFEPGERVMALLGHGGGGAAEYVKVRHDRAASVPRSVSPIEAAAIPLSGLTALQALRGAGDEALGPGARVLIHGAAGGIGSFAVQLARHFGAHVSATARPEKHDFVRGLGADEVFDAATFDFSAVSRPFDLVFDTPPALSFARVRPALGERGVMVSTRPIPTSPGDAAGFVARSGPRLVGVRTQERGADLAFLARLVDGGALRVPLDRVFALADIVDAHRHVEGRGAKGKTVVVVAADLTHGG